LQKCLQAAIQVAGNLQHQCHLIGRPQPSFDDPAIAYPAPSNAALAALQVTDNIHQNGSLWAARLWAGAEWHRYPHVPVQLLSGVYLCMSEADGSKAAAQPILPPATPLAQDACPERQCASRACKALSHASPNRVRPMRETLREPPPSFSLPSPPLRNERLETRRVGGGRRTQSEATVDWVDRESLSHGLRVLWGLGRPGP
jgi:hypothetical protein